MRAFSRNKVKADGAYEVMKLFQEAMHQRANKFNEEFPVGTFVKTWHNGEQDYNTTFCYITGKATVDLDEIPLTNYNIERYKECNNSKDTSCVLWRGIAINVWRIDDKEPFYYNTELFQVTETRHVEKSSIEEYRKYMLDRYESDLENYREQLKLTKQNIRDCRIRIRDIDINIKKAAEITKVNYDAEMNRRNRK